MGKEVIAKAVEVEREKETLSIRTDKGTTLFIYKGYSSYTSTSQLKVAAFTSQHQKTIYLNL